MWSNSVQNLSEIEQSVAELLHMVLWRPFCPSVKRVHCDKTKGTCAHILIPHEKSFILVFWQEQLMGPTHST